MDLLKLLLRRQNGQIIRANVNGTRDVIVYESDVFYVSLSSVGVNMQPESRRRLHFTKYWISGDEEYILLATSDKKVALEQRYWS